MCFFCMLLQFLGIFLFEWNLRKFFEVRKKNGNFWGCNFATHGFYQNLQKFSSSIFFLYLLLKAEKKWKKKRFFIFTVTFSVKSINFKKGDNMYIFGKFL